MKNCIWVLALSIFGLQILVGQNSEEYQKMIQEAHRLYEADSFESSVQVYERAFELYEEEVGMNDRYNLACCYALAKDEDKAFYQLFSIAEDTTLKYNRYWHIATDLDLDHLHGYDQWDELMKIVKNNKDEYEGVQDFEIVKVLDSVVLRDQRSRREYRRALEENEPNSEAVNEARQKVLWADSLNMVKVAQILDEHGWLGSDRIGRTGNNAMFLTLQHADLETQLKYLPMMREAVKEVKLRGGALALLEDRVSLRQGKKQIYGSQIGKDPETGERYVSPLIEPEKVNERRAAVGLGPLEDYVKKYGIDWNVEDHIERMEKINDQE